MALDLNVYTGKITYKNIDFLYTFDGDELRLIPPEDKKREVEKWFLTEIGNGVYTLGDSVYMEEDVLEGTCNESGYGFIFLVSRYHSIGRYNSVLIIPVISYIKKKLNCPMFDRIIFTSNELNYIYPTLKAIDKKGWSEAGSIEVSTKTFRQTTTLKHDFLVGEKEVKVQFGVAIMTDSKAKTSPLLLQSIMTFDFESTTDYAFIYELWLIAKRFIQYLCYRRNIAFSKVELAGPFQDGSHFTCADFFVMNEDEVHEETKPLEKGWFIKEDYIDQHCGDILTDIANKNLYMRHIPESYSSGSTINEARFVMITAAFEWEVRRLYSYSKSQNKKIPLKDKIIKVGEDLHSVIGAFGERLYHLNDEELNYKEMGERLAQQRNNFAHGNLDKEFIGTSLCDLIYLEYMIYAMQLRIYGVEDTKIQKSINDLFHLNFKL